MYLVITIDVEPDCSTSWKRSNPLTFNSVLEGIPKRLEPLFQEFGAKPTYLICGEVLENSSCVDVLISLDGNCELGTHLHGEYIEPYKKYYNYAGTKASDFPCFSYDKEIEDAKLSNLTSLFKEKIGSNPLSYRAGRFGADGETLQILEKLGYLIDSSVTPNISWRRKGGPDFTSAPEQPYHPDTRDICKRGESRILEVPITIDNKKFFLFPSFWFLYRWLRPSIASSYEMIDLIDYFMKKYSNNRYIVFNMQFHSMEIIPKATPYTKNRKDVNRFVSKLREVLKFCESINIRYLKLYEVYNFYKY